MIESKVNGIMWHLLNVLLTNAMEVAIGKYLKKPERVIFFI